MCTILTIFYHIHHYTTGDIVILNHICHFGLLSSYLILIAWSVAKVIIQISDHMAGNFRGKSEKALKINFCGFKFMTATSPGAWHCYTSDDVINTRSRDLLCY